MTQAQADVIIILLTFICITQLAILFRNTQTYWAVRHKPWHPHSAAVSTEPAHDPNHD